MDNTVGIDIKGNFNLRNSAWSRSDTFKVELTERLVHACLFSFTLKYVNCYSRLVVFSC